MGDDKQDDTWIRKGQFYSRTLGWLHDLKEDTFDISAWNSLEGAGEFLDFTVERYLKDGILEDMGGGSYRIANRTEVIRICDAFGFFREKPDPLDELMDMFSDAWFSIPGSSRNDYNTHCLAKHIEWYGESEGWVENGVQVNDFLKISYKGLLGWLGMEVSVQKGAKGDLEGLRKYLQPSLARLCLSYADSDVPEEKEFYTQIVGTYGIERIVGHAANRDVLGVVSGAKAEAMTILEENYPGRYDFPNEWDEIMLSYLEKKY